MLYISHTTNKLNFNSDFHTCFFNIVNENFIQILNKELNKYFKDIEDNNNNNLVLIADWSKMNLSNNSLLLSFLEDLINKSLSLNPPGWKRKYRGVRIKTPITLFNVFELKNIDPDFTQKVISLHQRIYILQENSNIFSLPVISSYAWKNLSPQFSVLSKEILERVVKDNLELIALSFLEKSAKSGYQLLQDVADHFHCILSQGTLYPLLYALEKQNKILKRNGKGREVIYSLNPKEKENMYSKIDSYLKTYKHLADFFNFKS